MPPWSVNPDGSRGPKPAGVGDDSDPEYPARVKGPGVRDATPRNQGRIYEYEIPAPGGGTKKVYISDHHRDPLHGGIGHTHQGVPKPGASSVEPGGRSSEVGELVPYDRR